MALLKLFAQLFPGMRVDTPDMQFIARDSQLGLLRQILSGAVMDGSIGRVIKGFTLSLNGSTLTCTGGRAILSLRGAGEVLTAVLVNDEESQTVDTTGLSGVKGVYLTARLKSQETRRRVFWDALATPATEFLRSVSTREALTFSVRIATNNPGSEWTQIATIDFSGGPTITPLRAYVFDSDEGITGITNWGAGGDRTAATGLELYFWARAVMRQLQDIIGASPLNFKAAIPRSLTQLYAEKLERNGSNDITGVLRPDGDNTRDLGTAHDASPARRFANLFARTGRFGQEILGEALLGSAANALLQRLEIKTPNITASGVYTRVRLLHIERDSSVATSHINVYATFANGLPKIEVAFNCEISATNEWSFVSNTIEAVVLRFDAWSIVALRRAPFAASPWADIVDAAAWTQRGYLQIGPAVADMVWPATDLLWNATRTFEKRLSALDGQVTNSAWRVYGTSATDPHHINKSAGGATGGYAFWRFEVPHGVTITDCLMHGQFTPGGGTLHAALVRFPNATSTPELLHVAAVNLSNGGIADAAVTPTLNNVVNNAVYSYGLWMQASDATAFVLNKIIIKYTTDKVGLY